MIRDVLHPEGVVPYVERRKTALSAKNSKLDIKQKFDDVSVFYYVSFVFDLKLFILLRSHRGVGFIFTGKHCV